MRQFAWLELYQGMWCLLTDITSESVNASRIWVDKDCAIAELSEEGWTISGPYPNSLSKKLRLGNAYHGYALMRTVY